MATVYRGTDTRLDRVLALKVMHPSLADDPEFTDRIDAWFADHEKRRGMGKTRKQRQRHEQ